MKTGFTTTITVDNTPGEVFNAINNVRGWWQGEIEGQSGQSGDEFTYRMPGHHFSRQKVTEFIPDRKVTWLVTDSELKFDDKTEWTGTEIIFEIDEIDGRTQLQFTHAGLVPAFACYGDCSWAWGRLIEESLFSLITTGKGTNVFG